MLFSEIIGSLQSDNGRHRIAVGPDWLQGYATLGGLVTALANAALRTHLEPDIPLRGLQVTFVAPVKPGSFELRTEILRRGKSVTVGRCDVWQEGSVRTSIIGSYGIARTPPLTLTPTATLSGVAVDSLPDAFFPDAPGYVEHFGLRWAAGGIPGAGSGPHSAAYLCHRDRTFGEAHVIALADALPSPAVSAATRATVGSTLQWTMELVDHQFAFDPAQWWLLAANVEAADDGYACHTSQLINPDGRVTALGRQLVAIF